jgi:hypothetical protein
LTRSISAISWSFRRFSRGSAWYSTNYCDGRIISQKLGDVDRPNVQNFLELSSRGKTELNFHKKDLLFGKIFYNIPPHIFLNPTINFFDNKPT